MKTFTRTFRIGPAPAWFEHRPSIPMRIVRIDFEEPVLVHGYANGNYVMPFGSDSPILVSHLAQGFNFVHAILPPHGVASLRLSLPLTFPPMSLEERDVEVVFSSDL